jgi:hypothetical protein
MAAINAAAVLCLLNNMCGQAPSELQAQQTRPSANAAGQTAAAVVLFMQACVLHVSCCKTQTCLWHCWTPSSPVQELLVQARMQDIQHTAELPHQAIATLLCYVSTHKTAHSGYSEMARPSP